MITTIHIENKAGKWTVNNKPYSEMNMVEREFFHNFLNEVRITQNEPFSEPQTVRQALTSVKEFINRINVNDPIFEQPLSKVETDYGNR